MPDIAQKVIVKINLPPEANYHSGHSIIVQGESAGEVAVLLQGLVPEAKDGIGGTILRRFVEYALLGAVKAELGATEEPSGLVGLVAPSVAGAQTPRPAQPAAARPPAPVAGEQKASEAILTVLAKKTGKSVEELGSLTDLEAKGLLKGAK